MPTNNHPLIRAQAERAAQRKAAAQERRSQRHDLVDIRCACAVVYRRRDVAQAVVMALAQHEIEAAKIWREEGDVDRALQHLEYALGYLQDEQAAEQCVEADEGDSPDEEE